MTNLDPGKVNLGKLRALYNRKKAAQALLDHFARRKNALKQTSVDRLLAVLRNEEADVSRAEVIDVLKELEAIGGGAFRVGRRGWPSRFEWKVDLVSVGQAAAGERKEVEVISEDAAEEEPEDMAFVHYYQLRPGFQVKLDLPRDLTGREAGRLAEFIKTLPFDAGEA